MLNINKKSLDDLINTYDFYNQNKYEIKIVDPNTRLLKVMNKQSILTYDKNEMDKNLMNKETTDLLYSYSLELPSEYKDKSLKELREALNKSPKISSEYKDIINNVAKYDYFEGKSIAYPKNKNPSAKTLKNIAEHNILEIYNYNLNLLREYKEKQALVFYISATLFNFSTDLNYLGVRFWLEIMV